MKIINSSSRDYSETRKISFSIIYRITFTVFFLYLMGDAFYRWDGFSYYASFWEFLPSLALISVLWSIVALITAILIWISIRISELLCICFKQKIKTEHLQLFIMVFFLLSAAVWIGKQSLAGFAVSRHYKIIIVWSVVILSGTLTWLFRHKAKNWNHLAIKGITFIQDRISPLVWLFGIWVIVSMPIVAYNAWFQGSEKTGSYELTEYSKSDKKRPNILLVTYDALSARNMSLYGYHRQTTPFISKWSKEASVFTRAKSAGNITSPTAASLMTGKRVWGHLRFNRMADSKPVKTDTESIPFLLKKNGYYNMAFIANPIASVKRLGLESFFNVAPPAISMHNINNISQAIRYFLVTAFGERIKLSSWILQEDFIFGELLNRYLDDIHTTSYSPELAFNKFLHALDENIEKPYFAWIHVNPPHSPYLPPEPYMGMFDSSEKMRSYKSIVSETDKMYSYKEVHGRFPDSVMLLEARYDEFIRYCDKQFEEFIKKLKNEGKMDNTVILLSTDHGESFRFDSLGHGGSLYEPETHIPVIIKLPGQAEGNLVDNLIEQIDIPATILDLADINVPSWMDGNSLLPLITGQKVNTKPVFSMVLEKNSSRGEEIKAGVVSVWEGNHKLIYDIGNQESLLFNIKTDPDELDNLVDKEPAAGKHLLNLIQVELKKANEKILRAGKESK